MPDIADVAWSEHDERNTEAVPNGWPTGAFPAYTDLVGQMMMGATKRFWNKINPVYQTTGTGDDYVVQTEIGIDQINLYEILCIRIDRTNTTTTPTLQFGATNARTIVKAGPSGYVPLAAGDMYAGNSHTFWYNGAFYVLTDPALIVGTTVQPYSPNLTTWAAITRAAGFDSFAASGILPVAMGGTNAPDADTARLNLAIDTYVSSIAAMQALDVTKNKVVVLTAAGRSGTFVFNSSNLSSQVTSDPQHGVYVAPSSDPTGASGALVRVYNGAVWVEWFGAVGDGTTDDSTAINAALTFVGNNGYVRLSGVTYAVASTIGVYKGQMLEGITPPGDVFGATINPGTALTWTGATGGTVLGFGADPAIVTGQVKPKGGGLKNLQIYGGTTANVLWRISSCDNARFQDIKLVSLRDNSSATCLYGLPNATEAGFENTTRFCTFDRITIFAYGAGHGLRNFTNGTEGGFTFCRFSNMFCEFGGNTGAGNGFYFSSMDDCVFTLIDASRLAGGTGQGIYLDGNAVSGKVVYGNTFNFVKLSGGAPLLADGRYSSGNKVYGLSGVDEVPTVLQTNNGWIDVEYLGTGYGDTPGTVSQQPTTVRAKDAANASVTTMLTLSHDLNAAASAPAIGIGSSMVFEALTSAGNKKAAATLEASMTNVTAASETSKLVLKLMSSGTSTSFVTFTPTLVSMVGVNPSYYIESTGTGGAANAGVSMKTGNHTNVWQFITKAGGFVIGVQSVADYTTWSTTGDITHAGNFSIGTGKVATPQTNDGAALGTTALQWSDLFLASGGVINFNNGNATLTHGTLGRVVLSGSLGRGAPATQTTSFSLADTQNWVICNGTATITVTLPAASSYTGREVTIRTIAAFTVVSASSNVVPLAGGAAGTAILAATAGKWATLVSDGTNWQIMAGN